MEDPILITLGRDFFLVSAAARGFFDPLMIERQYWAGRGEIFGSSEGRGTALFVGKSRRMVLRHYFRGGMMSKISRDKFLFLGNAESSRAFKEFRMLEKLIDLGIDVPAPVAARVRLAGAMRYTCDLLTMYAEGAEDLAKIGKSRNLTIAELEDIGIAIGKLIKHGVYHSDLNVRNIMVDSSGKIWVIDFDKCGFTRGKGKEMLSRLGRSFAKERSLCGDKTSLCEEDFARIKEACMKYVGNGGKSLVSEICESLDHPDADCCSQETPPASIKCTEDDVQDVSRE